MRLAHLLKSELYVDDSARYVVMAEAYENPEERFEVFLPDAEIAREVARAVSSRHSDMRVVLLGPGGEEMQIATSAQHANTNDEINPRTATP